MEQLVLCTCYIVVLGLLVHFTAVPWTLTIPTFQAKLSQRPAKRHQLTSWCTRHRRLLRLLGIAVPKFGLVKFHRFVLRIQEVFDDQAPHTNIFGSVGKKNERWQQIQKKTFAVWFLQKRGKVKQTKVMAKRLLFQFFRLWNRQEANSPSVVSLRSPSDTITAFSSWKATVLGEVKVRFTRNKLRQIIPFECNPVCSLFQVRMNVSCELIARV